MNTVLFVNATIGFSENLFLVKYLCLFRRQIDCEILGTVDFVSHLITRYV